jgi:hypothetical protein
LLFRYVTNRSFRVASESVQVGENMFVVRIHGKGGQGAVAAANMLSFPCWKKPCATLSGLLRKASRHICDRAVNFLLLPSDTSS